MFQQLEYLSYDDVVVRVPAEQSCKNNSILLSSRTDSPPKINTYFSLLNVQH